MEFDMEDPLSALCCPQEEEGEEEEEVVVSSGGGGRAAGQGRSSSVAALFAAESDHMYSRGNTAFDATLRRDAASIILQAQFSSDLDPLVAYLAVNYVDRFLSRRDVPTEKPWIVRLIAIACLSLASKMKKVGFSVSDFQREEGFIFDTQTIRRMEMLVLGALDWRMRSITPFSFLRYFLSLFRPRDPAMMRALKARASQIIFKAQNEMKLMEYKPSEIAASALLTAAQGVFPIQSPSFRNSVSSCSYVNKEKLWECCDVIKDAIPSDSLLCYGDPSTALSSSCDTPVTVLHHRHCPSSESDLTTDVGSVALGGKKKPRVLRTPPPPLLRQHRR